MEPRPIQRVLTNSQMLYCHFLSSQLLQGSTSPPLLLLASRSISFYHHVLAPVRTRSLLLLLNLTLAEPGFELVHHLLCISQRVFRLQCLGPTYPVIQYIINNLLPNGFANLPDLVDADRLCAPGMLPRLPLGFTIYFELANERLYFSFM